MNNELQAKVMILGTFHMRYTPDLYRVDASDVLESHRQEEIREVLERIKEFKPTKIAFEVVKDESEKLNRDYQNYLHDNFQLEVNEIHQLGFRLAEEMGHEEVYAVDWMESVGNIGMGQVFDWAKENQPEMYQSFKQKYPAPSSEEIKQKSIYEHIRELNEENHVKKDHEQYMAVARIGEGSNYVGIDWVRWWYQRNLIIYSNLANITKLPQDRTLMLVGSGHVYLLNQFLRESGMFEVVSANDYLLPK
ncbi:DUF5694 domain-containing protein [Thalassobacillus hwangdonensis]|uniref:DUF5694 domain-containing protein n=1 Tax=Thalassobacillus hwangdonensis TaxID=546108 RepID=A0ABW3L147_9BACI